LRTSLLDESFLAYIGIQYMEYMNKETVFTVWNQAVAVETFFSGHLFGTDVESLYQQYIQSLILPNVNRLGFTAIEGESSNDASLRGLITTLSCKTYQQNCLNYELQRLTTFVSTGTGSFSLCDGLRNADAAIHSQLINQLIQGEASSRTTYLNNLGCPLNQNLINNYLQLSLDNTNGLTSNERLTVIRQTAPKSILALETVMDFIQQNYVTINTINENSLNATLFSMTSYINSLEHQLKYGQVLDTLLGAGLINTADSLRHFNAINVNNDWISIHYETIVTYLTFGQVTDVPTETPSTAPPTTAAPTTVPPTTVLSTSAPTTPAPATESTTQGTGSLTASFAIIFVCVMRTLIY